MPLQVSLLIHGRKASTGSNPQKVRMLGLSGHTHSFFQETGNTYKEGSWLKQN